MLTTGGTALNPSVTVMVTDLAGNVTSITDLEVEPMAVPTIGSVMDDVGGYQGPLVMGAVTDDATPTLHGVGATAGGQVRIYDGAGVLGTATADDQGHWFFTPSAPLANGPHTLSAAALDPAGNEGPHSPGWTITVDTALVEPASGVLSDGGYNGMVLNGANGVDTTFLVASAATHVVGGDATDTVAAQGAHLNLDLANMTGIEKVDLGAGADNSLSITLQDLIADTLSVPSPKPGWLMVTGDATDTVKLAAADGFHDGGVGILDAGVTYDVWTDPANQTQLLLQQGLTVQQVP
jgi:hypothetical protein